MEQLVRVQVELSVETVAIVEVAVHDHLVAAEVFHRPGPDLIVARVAGLCHAWNPAAGLRYTTRPPTIVAATPPLKDQP